MHEDLPVLLLAPLGGLAADLLVQVVLSRLPTGGAHLRNQFVSVAIGAGVTTLALAALLAQQPLGALDKLGYLLLHLMAYFLYAFCLFNVISANVSSLRVRLLREYLSQHPAPLPDVAVFERYQAREMFGTRLARLQSGGQIRSVAGRHYTRKGFVLLIGWLFERLRSMLLPR
jgi:hypothetical protein